MKYTDRAYLAGLVDGEGCITICRRKKARGQNKNWYYEPQVDVANTDKRIIDCLVDLCGGWVATPKKNKDHHKQGYYWKITGDNMRQFLRDILPYLRGKKEQARTVLQFPTYEHKGCNGRTQKEMKKQEDLWARIKQLNKKGFKPVKR